jgi:hypothetical protein
LRLFQDYNNYYIQAEGSKHVKSSGQINYTAAKPAVFFVGECVIATPGLLPIP